MVRVARDAPSWKTGQSLRTVTAPREVPGDSIPRKEPAHVRDHRLLRPRVASFAARPLARRSCARPSGCSRSSVPSPASAAGAATDDGPTAAGYAAGWLAARVTPEGFVPDALGDPSPGDTLQTALALATAGVDQTDLRPHRRLAGRQRRRGHRHRRRHQPGADRLPADRRRRGRRRRHRLRWGRPRGPTGRHARRLRAGPLRRQRSRPSTASSARAWPSSGWWPRGRRRRRPRSTWLDAQQCGTARPRHPRRLGGLPPRRRRLHRRQHRDLLRRRHEQHGHRHLGAGRARA